MKLSEHPRAVAWLRQFDSNDVFTARLVIDSLKLVSFSEFEASILDKITKILETVPGKIALFTIDDLTSEKESEEESDEPGSENRLLHTFTNAVRLYKGRILIKPTEQEMFDCEVDAIVLVDDFVASGQRLLSFWQNWKLKRCKSWISFKYCSLWVVGYAIHKNGLEKVCRIRGLNRQNMLFEVEIETRSKYWRKPVLEFFEEQARRLPYVPFSSNFGGIQCPLIFQHGCPDNAPEILIKSSGDYRAIFPNRGIHPSFYPCFEQYEDSWRQPDLLLRSGQPTLAESLIADLAESKGSSMRVEMTTVLGLLRRGVSSERLSSVLTMSQSEIDSILIKCIALGLINKLNHITRFGIDIIERSRRRFLKGKSEKSIDTDEGIYYVPVQANKSLWCSTKI